MEIHELNTFSGTLGSGDYFATDNGNDTSKVSAEAMFAPLNERIDNIIAGPASSAQEVIDARTGDDAITYASLGLANRTQFFNVKGGLNQQIAKLLEVSPNLYDKSKPSAKPGYYLSGGAWASTGGNARLGASHAFYLTEGTTYKWDSAQVVYGSNDGYLCKLSAPVNGDVVERIPATQSGIYNVATANATGWYAVNIDMEKKDMFMFCISDFYPDYYVGYGELGDDDLPFAVEAAKKQKVMSPNLFNKNDDNIQTTRFVNGSSWREASSPQLGTTHPIYCQKGVTYKFKGAIGVYGEGNGRMMALLDSPSTMNIIDVISGTWDEDGIYVTCTCNKSGYYVIDIDRFLIDSFMFCPEDIYPDYYIGYGVAKVSENYPNASLTFSNSNAKHDHISIADFSPNMFNKDDEGLNTNRWAKGSGWQPSGADSHLGATHPILLEEGKTYRWLGAYKIYGDINASTAWKVRLPGDGAVIGADQVGEWTDSSKTYVELKCTSTAYYVIDINIQEKDLFMICEADKYPSRYMAYDTLYANDNMKYDGIEVSEHPLKDKVLVCDGDSIAAATPDDPEGLGGWFGRMQLNLLITGRNYAVGGGTITYIDSNRHCICRSIDTIHNNFPTLDYLIVDGGTNDADLIGRFNGDTPPENFGTWSETDYSGNYDDTTFCGAVDSMFYKAVTYYPHAHIGFIIAMQMGTNNATSANRKRYFDEAEKIAKKWHIPVLNLWDNSGADSRLTAFYDPNKTIAENVEAHKFYRDGQHPSSYGYNKMQPMIEAWVKSL